MVSNPLSRGCPVQTFKGGCSYSGECQFVPLGSIFVTFLIFCSAQLFVIVPETVVNKRLDQLRDCW